MINVSDALKTVYRTNILPQCSSLADIQLNMIFTDPDLTIDNEDMKGDSFSLEQSICSENDLVFGSCEASVMKITVANILDDLTNKTFVLKQIVNRTNEVQLGVFTVKSCTQQEDKRFKDIVAYDNIKKFDTDVATWYNGLDWTNTMYTLKTFEQSLCAHTGVEYVDKNLPNDSMPIEKTIAPERLNGWDVLKACEELHGCFGHADVHGNLDHVVLAKGEAIYPNENLWPSEGIWPGMTLGSDRENIAVYKKLKHKEYRVTAIDKVQIREDEDDVGAIYGNGNNCYSITGNFLLYGKSAEDLATIAENVYSNIAGIEYTPCESSNIGLPYLEAGDAVEFNIGEETVTSYIMSRTLSGIQCLTDVYKASGNKERSQNVSVNEEIKQLKGKTHKIVNTVEEMSHIISDEETGILSQLLQLSNKIVLIVDDNGNIAQIELGSSEEGTNITIQADNISLEGLVTANGNFKIQEDGSMVAEKGGKIAGFNITYDSENGDGGIVFKDETTGKFIRISPYSSMNGQGGYNTDFGAIDLGLDNDGNNTLIHLRSDGYARFGLVSAGGYSVRFNDFLRYLESGGAIGTETILYTQNFSIGTDGQINGTFKELSATDKITAPNLTDLSNPNSLASKIELIDAKITDIPFTVNPELITNTSNYTIRVSRCGNYVNINIDYAYVIVPQNKQGMWVELIQYSGNAPMRNAWGQVYKHYEEEPVGAPRQIKIVSTQGGITRVLAYCPNVGGEEIHGTMQYLIGR